MQYYLKTLPPEIAKTIALLLSDYDDPEIIEPGGAIIPESDENVETTTAEGLKEKYMVRPDTEDRPITDDELDKLIRRISQKHQK